MDSGFHNQQPGFWIAIMVGFRIPLAGFRIPKPWIPDFTDQNYLDSGLPYMGRMIALLFVMLNTHCNEEVNFICILVPVPEWLLDDGR